MQAIINHLIQLQELALTRDERRTAGRPQKELAPLDENISTMAAELPTPVRSMYARLFKKDHTVICPVSEGYCSGCGLKFPISLVQEVKLSKEMKNCPSCSRYLYVPASAPRRVGKAPRRSAPRKVGIARFSSPALVVARLSATDRDGAIRELADAMQDNGFVDDADGLYEAALRRESIASTAMEHGLAFPHVRGVEGGGLALALGISKKGIKFDSGRTLTRIIFFIAIPTAASAFYLKLLSGLAETFSSKDVRDKLLAQKDADSTWDVLVKATRKTIK